MSEKKSQSGYKTLKAKFANGDDVTPHLSSNILNDTYEDYLLNDWGIHHFHLGQNISDGFAGRTGPLLFALITNSNVTALI